jgi:hypothetical protein
MVDYKTAEKVASKNDEGNYLCAYAGTLTKVAGIFCCVLSIFIKEIWTLISNTKLYSINL